MISEILAILLSAVEDFNEPKFPSPRCEISAIAQAYSLAISLAIDSSSNLRKYFQVQHRS